MSKIEVNAIEPQCGTTLTLGESGDTVTLGAGASQSGFGRTGTVDWDTTAKTSAFTAVSGNGYFVNTTSGAVTMTLPATPSAGDIVAVSDYAQNAATNNITLARNGSNIQGDASDLVIQRNGVAMTLVFVDATKGWIVTDTGAEADKNPDPAFIAATGGTITCCGDYKIHTFTGPGTFTVTCAGNTVGSNSVDYLVVAGGASGGASNISGNGSGGGGGGAGGYRESSGTASGCYTASPLGTCVAALPVSVQGYPITIGGGGAGVPISPSSDNDGINGSNSVFSTIISAGGGAGGGGAGCGPNYTGKNGGSGGGGGNNSGSTVAGSGNTPPVSPPQGNNGGVITPPGTTPGYGSAGGGGATAVGSNGTNTAGGNGGAGATSSINGTPTARAGGGGGGLYCGSPAGTGGTGGGGDGGGPGGAGSVGTINTGGGGGGRSLNSSYNGGSGIVIIRYKFQ